VTGRGAQFITGLFFNYRSDLGRSITFRRAVSLSVERSALVCGNPFAREQEHLAPSWMTEGKTVDAAGRNIEEARRLFASLEAAGRLRPLTEIGLFRYEPESPEWAWLAALSRQLTEAGFRHDFEPGRTPFFSENDAETPFWIIDFIPSSDDPLVLYEVFCKNGPWRVGDIDDRDNFESALRRCRRLPFGARRDEALLEMMRTFRDHCLAVPLFEKITRAQVRTARVADAAAALDRWMFHSELVRLKG
jgi:hypothetical protein